MKNILSPLFRNTLLIILFIGLSDSAFAQSPATSIDASRYSNLQQAVDALPAGGGIVIIPPGNYEINKPIVIKTENTRLQGSGGSTHLINQNTSGEPAILVRADKGTLFRIEMSGFRISGNKQSGDGIYMEKVQELMITDMTIDHNGGHGINMKDCTENPRIANCNLNYNIKAGINIDGGHDIVVSGNQFEENQDALRIKDGFNLTMTGNNIDDHLRHGIVVENTYGSIISSNMIEECQGTAIILTAPASPENRFCYGITISANVIAHHLGGGIELNKAWGCTVSSNTFTLVHNFSILAGPGTGGISITGNNFSNSRGKLGVRNEKNPFTWDVGSGVVLKSATDITVSGNFFGKLTTEAVKADDSSSGILVSGNLLTELNQGAQGIKKAIDLGAAKEVLVKDNLIRE